MDINKYMEVENMDNLKRSNSNKVFSGVCGGLGEFLNIDPTIIRIVWALFIIKSFSFSFLIYIICSLIIPSEDNVVYYDENENNEKGAKNTRLVIGGGFVIWGILLLSDFMFPRFRFRISHLIKYWPGLLIILGLYIIYSEKNKY